MKEIFKPFFSKHNFKNGLFVFLIELINKIDLLKARFIFYGDISHNLFQPIAQKKQDTCPASFTVS